MSPEQTATDLLLRQRGATATEIADALGVTLHTAQRRLREARVAGRIVPCPDSLLRVARGDEGAAEQVWWASPTTLLLWADGRSSTPLVWACALESLPAQKGERVTRSAWREATLAHPALVAHRTTLLGPQPGWTDALELVLVRLEEMFGAGVGAEDNVAALERLCPGAWPEDLTERWDLTRAQRLVWRA